MSVLLGLITYFIHGLMNNFLDTDKASVPVWGFIAILVAMDIYSLKKQATDTPNQVNGPEKADQVSN
jgi:hypothetical protein